MMRKRSWIAAALAAALWAVGGAQAALYAWIAHGGGISAIDVERLTVAATISVPAQDVAALPGVRHVYALHPLQGVRKIDADALAVVAAYDDVFLFNAQEIELKPGRDEAYVGSGGQVHVMRADVMAYMGTLEEGLANHTPAIDAIGGRAYFPDVRGAFEFDLASNRLLRQLAYGSPVLATHPAARRLYMVEIGRIRVLDLVSGSLVADVQEPRLTFAQAARVDPNTNRLLVTDSMANAVHIFDASSLALLTTVPVGNRPYAIDVTPTGGRAFVINESSGDVSVIDLASLTQIARIPVGGSPTARGRFIGGSTDPVSLQPGPATGLWWNAAEPGWGVHVTQRRSTFFAALFHYDRGGAPKWYIGPSCAMNTPCPNCVDNVICNGPVYEASGSLFFDAAFSAQNVQRREVGIMELSFANREQARLTYVIEGERRAVDITRQVFAQRAPLPTDYTDLWWNPNESGWGLGITQQSNVMFLAWFVYDVNARPTWLVASNCRVTAAGNGCRGSLYRTSGPPGPAPASFDSRALRVSEVGTIDVTFTDANTGLITYTVDGRSGSKPITRQLF